MVIFRYYSLGGSTATLSRLYAKLCHAFSVSFLMTTRTLISGSTGPIFAIFSRYEMFRVQMIDLNLFFRHLKGRCHGNQFCVKIANFCHLLLWYSETEWNITTLMCAFTAQMIPLHCVKYRQLWSSNSRVDRAHL